jgi:hypothetical protein
MRREGKDTEYERRRSKLAGVVLEKSTKATADRIVLRDAVCDYIISRQTSGASEAAILGSVTRMLGGTDGNPAGLAHHLVEWCGRRQRNVS